MSEKLYDTAWPQYGPPMAEVPDPAPVDSERLAYIDELKTQIRKGVYRLDIRDLARSLASMMVRDL